MLLGDLAGRDAQVDTTKDRLKEARKLLSAYTETPSPATFLPLLDWSYLSVHGDLDARDNVGLRAIYDWTRDEVAFPALERWITTDNDADLLELLYRYAPDEAELRKILVTNPAKLFGYED